MRKRKRQTVKKLIQYVAIIAAGVLAIILFMLAIWYRGKNSEPVTDEQVAAQMQQAEPLVIETPEAATEGSIRVYDYDGCCIYSYYGKIRINSDGKDGKEIDVEAIGYLEGYINKAEAEKTDEQRCSEEQDAIDRQTKKKLQERADAEKMEHLPSEGNIEHKQHELKIVASDYEDVISGKKSFELRKNDRGYKQGDSLKMLEFKDCKHTGRTIDADIIYMLEDYTGLTEGYCILGIRVTDYTGKVSETDTESGAVNV